MPRPSNSGRHGVHFDAHRNRYKVTVCLPTGGYLHGGYYEDCDEAARKYDDLAVEVYGATGAVPFLNFPREAREKESLKKKSAAKAEPADGATRATG